MGGFGADIAHLLDGLAVALCFALLLGQRTERLIRAYAAQAIVVAAASAWQGWLQGSGTLLLAALLGFASKGIAIPAALRLLVQRLDLPRQQAPALGFFPLLLTGVALVALSVLVVLPNSGMRAASSADALAREGLALSLSVVLLGLLMMITRRSALNEMIGFLAMENGLGLAACGVPGMPWAVDVAIAAMVLVAAAVLAGAITRMQQRFSSLDIRLLDRIGLTRR